MSRRPTQTSWKRARQVVLASKFHLEAYHLQDLDLQEIKVMEWQVPLEVQAKQPLLRVCRWGVVLLHEPPNQVTWARKVHRYQQQVDQAKGQLEEEKDLSVVGQEDEVVGDITKLIHSFFIGVGILIF